MALTTVDREKCTQCGLCARACPVGIVVLEDGFPRTIEKIEKGCVTCGHCVAICPPGALEHCRMTPEDCTPLAPDWRISPERMSQLVKARRSMRRFRPEPVDRATIEALLDAVRYAPTGMNIQSVRWLVILDSAKVQRLAAEAIDWVRALGDAPGARGMLKAWEMGRDPILRGAPHLLVAYGHADDVPVTFSAVVALATAELAAPSFGLGTCWAGFLHQAANSSPRVQAALELPPNCRMCGAVMLGYPELEFARIPARRPAQVTWR